jgi:ADP-ribose pyrophosphatase YjhB (NUDIX family)
MNNVEPDGPRVRAAAIIVKDGEILLVRHVKHGRTYWLLPGGGVKYGETIEEAIVREIKEETNLDIVVQRPVMMNDSVPPDRHRHVLNICFTARITGGTLQTEDSEVLKEVKFVPIDTISDLPLFRPDIRTPLLEAYNRGFPETLYLGNIWTD